MGTRFSFSAQTFTFVSRQCTIYNTHTHTTTIDVGLHLVFKLTPSINKILHTYNNNLIFFIFAPTSNDLNSVRIIQSQIRRTVLKHRTRYTTHLPIIDDGQWTYIKLYRDRNNVNNTVEIRFDCTQQEWKEKNGKAYGASNIFCCYLFVILYLPASS